VVSIHHVALFRWKPGTTPEQIEAVRTALLDLRHELTGCESYICGADLGQAKGNHDFAVVAGFADHDAYEGYADHPRHNRIKAELIVPILAERAAVQFGG
jgi:hypothetical protein